MWNVKQSTRRQNESSSGFWGAAPWLRPFSTSQPAMQTTSRSTASGRCSSTTSSWTSSSSSTLMASRMRMGGTALLWRVSRLRNSASSSSLPFSKRAFWEEKSGNFATEIQILRPTSQRSSSRGWTIKSSIEVLSVLTKTRGHQLQHAFHFHSL